MAQFSLKQTVNRFNNPSLDGIFEYGMFDPVTLAFTPFDTYGYEDGSPVDFNNLDSSKVLGWYKSSVGGYPHLAFENIQGNSNITPQPFPNQGVYIHPAVSWVQGVNANVGVRIHVLSPATFQVLTGSTIEAADNNCGDNINYRIRKNNTDLIPNTVVAHGSGQHAINTTVSSVTTGDTVDIMAGIGNSGDNPFCDDIALEALIEIIPTKVNTPTIDTFLCSDTSVIGHVSLQTVGTIEMYNSSNTLIGTGTITADGYNGVATITGLNLSAGGGFYFIAKNTGQADSDPTTTITIASCCTAPAITTQPIGYSICDTAPTALSVVATGTATLLYQWYRNGVAIGSANSSTYTPSVSGDYKVEITNGCGNVMSSEVTVSISSSPSVASGGTIPDAVTLTAYSHNITLSGTAPFAISSVVKPSWMVVSLAGNVVSLTGNPALTDAGTGITVSFTITGSCTPLNFSDTLNVTSTCSAVGGGAINGNALVVNGVSNLFTVTGLTGTAPFTYSWSATNGVIDSGQSTDQAYATFSANGSINVSVQNCAGLNIINLTLPVNLVTADAINDLVGLQITAQQHTLEIDNNDIVCNGGAVTTYEFVSGSEVNVVVNSINATTGTALYTPIADGAFSFQYAIKCDGVILDGATVSGTAYTPCVNVTGGLIFGNTNVIAGIGEVYNLTGLTGTTPYNITWGGTGGVVVTSGQGTTTATITRASTGTVTAVVTNCAGLGSVSLSYNVTVITADAVNDAVGNKVTGIATNSQISTNDVVCNVGATTYELVAGSETNVVVNSIDPNTGIANYTPTADGAFSFNYVIKCGGTILDTATISGTGYTPCVPISVVVTGNKYPVSNALVTYTASPLIAGTWAITGGAIIQSGQGTGVAQIKYPAVPYIADLTFQYVTCGNTIIVMRKVYMSLPPCCQDCCDSGCC
jgi:hypothetical protein